MDKQAMVREFHKKQGFAQDILKNSGMITTFERAVWHQTGNIRLALVQEEIAELAYAWAAKDFTLVADAIADLLYVTYGIAVTTGIDIDEVFAEVHASNMTKEVAGGELKPKGMQYKEPVIEPILRKHGIIV